MKNKIATQMIFTLLLALIFAFLLSEVHYKPIALKQEALLWRSEEQLAEKEALIEFMQEDMRSMQSQYFGVVEERDMYYNEYRYWHDEVGGTIGTLYVKMFTLEEALDIVAGMYVRETLNKTGS